MKKLLAVLLVGMFILTGCGATEEAELTNIGTYDECVLELKDGEVFISDDGVKMLCVNATFTNNNEEPYYALSCFAVKAFQDDAEITDCSDINGSEASLIQEVKNGKSIEVAYVFEIASNSEVEVIIGTPTADEETIGINNYSVTEE